MCGHQTYLSWPETSLKIEIRRLRRESINVSPFLMCSSQYRITFQSPGSSAPTVKISSNPSRGGQILFLQGYGLDKQKQYLSTPAWGIMYTNDRSVDKEKKKSTLKSFIFYHKFWLLLVLHSFFMARNLRQKYFCVEIIACHAEQTKQNKASWRFILFNVNVARPLKITGKRRMSNHHPSLKI